MMMLASIDVVDETLAKEQTDETRQRRRAGVGLLLHATYGTCSLIRSPIKTSPMQAGHVPGLDPGHDRHD